MKKILISVIILVVVSAIIMSLYKPSIISPEPKESSVYFWGKIIPESKQIFYSESQEGGVQIRAVIIPIDDARYIIANFSWKIFPVKEISTGIKAESVYIFENDKFIKISPELELYGNDVRGNILVDGEKSLLNIPESEFVEYSNTNGMSNADLIRRLPLIKGFKVVN